MGLRYPCLKPEFTPLSIDVRNCTLISVSSGCNHIVCLTNEGTVLTFGMLLTCTRYVMLFINLCYRIMLRELLALYGKRTGANK